SLPSRPLASPPLRASDLTSLGLKLRAVASNRDSARLHGIRSGTMLMFGWGLSAAIGALAGTLVASDRNALDASLMQVVLVYALRSEEHTSELQSRENLVC